MRILYVIHQFLPQHRAGSELYTFYLAREMRRRGHEVHIYTTGINAERPQYTLEKREYRSLPVLEVTHQRDLADLGQLWNDPRMDTVFARVLTETSPQMVHFQHLQFHGLGAIEVARARGLPMIYTLHEYMLMCLNLGLLLRPGGDLCDGPEPEACTVCAERAYPGLSPEPGRPTGAKEPAGSLLDGLRRFFRGDTSRRRAHERLRAHLRARKDLLAPVDLFIAPSAFLRDRFLASGLVETEKMIHSDYGMAITQSAEIPRRRETGLRVGFVGTIVEWKGVHVLIEAFSGIDDPAVTCRIFGDPTVAADYTERLSRLPGFSRVELAGPFDNADLGEVMATIDVLVVPSVWYENSPLTIHEAFCAGVPVIASDLGGMAELVENDRNGLLFEPGRADHLRAQILRLAHEPGLLERLADGRPEIKTMATDAGNLEARYRSLVEKAHEDAEATR